MGFAGARVVILCRFFVHFVFTANYFLFSTSSNSSLSLISLVQAVSLFFYPLLGWLAGLSFSRYKFIKVSTGLLLIISFLLFIYILIILLLIYFTTVNLDPVPLYVAIIAIALLIGLVAATGIFEATGVQFGMDQMVEARSDQISTFIHWYYWSAHVGTGVQALVGICTVVSLGLCNIELHIPQNDWSGNFILYTAILLPALLLQFLFSTCAFLCLQETKRERELETHTRAR